MGVYLPLPSEYQEVEYIQSSGTQYIDTGYTPKTTSEFEVKFQNVSAINTYRTILGTRQDSSNNSFWIGWQANKSYYQFSPTNSEVSSSNGWFNTGVDYTLELKNKNLVNNGTTVASSINFTHNANYTLYLFSGHAYNKTNPFEPSATKIYYCKLREGGTLVRDFVPCYRKSDNVIGLYDLVNSVFYTNSGTGTCSKGADVTAVPLKNAYIGGVYEYSYDFRNKTTSQVQTDGWTIGSGVSFDSNGAYSSTWSSTTKAIPFSIENAKKIILTAGLYNANNMNCSYAMRNTASSATNGCGIYLEGYSSSYSQYSLNGVNTNFTISEPSGQSYWTYTLDFENLTYSIVYGTVYTKSGTMTQAQANAIKSNNKYLRFAVQHGTGRIQYVKITANY